jgi:Putative transposase/Transposase zinc-binding domain
VALHLADLLGEHWESYAQAHRHQLNADHYRAVRRVLACRTPALGGRLYECNGCQSKQYAYHSCNHRSCPQCGALDQQIWTAKQEARLLPVPYFMVTFTLPEELRTLCLTQPEILYPLILRQSAAALQDVCATKHQGARLGFTSVLHTWGRQIQHHPHVHLIVPAVAFHPKHQTLHHPAKDSFLIHYHPLAERFRSRIHSTLKNEHPDIYQNLTGIQRHVLSPAKTWNVQLQHAGSGRTALRYLARYVQRSAFAAKRLIGYNKHGNVLLYWTSSSTGKTAVMALHPHELIRRWLLHVLPKGLTRIRHYGYLGSAAKKTRLRIRALLGSIGEPAPQLPEPKPFTCQCCGGVLTFLREIAPIRLLRAPPSTEHRI